MFRFLKNFPKWHVTQLNDIWTILSTNKLWNKCEGKKLLIIWFLVMIDLKIIFSVVMHSSGLLTFGLKMLFLENTIIKLLILLMNSKVLSMIFFFSNNDTANILYPCARWQCQLYHPSLLCDFSLAFQWKLNTSAKLLCLDFLTSVVWSVPYFYDSWGSLQTLLGWDSCPCPPVSDSHL